MRCVCVVLLVASALGAPVLADVVYVRAGASGANDGSSWTDAFTSFNDALGAAQPGDEIWAAMGTYFVPGNLGFVAPVGVSLYGGFVGNEASRTERAAANRTNLSGFHPGRGAIVLTLNDPTPGTVVDAFRFDGTLTIDHDGGGLAVYGGTVSVSNCLFIDNISGSGAGAYLSGVHATFTDCIFDNNFCQVGDGGGIEAVGTGSLTVERCTFVDNLARELFGVVGRGGGIFNDEGSVLRVRDCVFDNNLAYNLGQQIVATGGGVANRSPDARIESCLFIRNDATLGGAISSDAPIEITNCLMTGNRATEPPVATPFESGQGGAVFGPEGVDLHITDCTIVANWSKHTAGGLWMDGLVENSIVFGNVSLVEPNDNPEPLVDQQFQGDIVFRHSCVAGILDGGAPDPRFPGTIESDPLFVQAPTVSNAGAFVEGDARLQAGSPCLDAGDNAAVPVGVTTDLDGLARFVDDPDAPNVGPGAPPHVDMGAYERQSDKPECRADFNNSGTLDSQDFFDFLQAFFSDEPSADFNQDSFINSQDFFDFLGAFFEGC